MRVVDSAPEFVVIRGRRAVRSSLLLGVALFACVALALSADPATRGMRHFAGWTVVGLASVILVFFGWPRRRTIVLRREDSAVDIDGTKQPLGDARFRLAGVRRNWSAGPREYGVLLERAPGGAVLFLSDPSPDRVLRDLAVVRGVLPLPVVSGWNLPLDSPWTRAADGSRAAPSEKEGSRGRERIRGGPTAKGRTKRSIVGTLLVGCAGVSAIIVIDVEHRIALGDAPAALSLVLPAVSVAVLLSIALAIATGRTTLELGSELRAARLLFGLAIERRSIPRSAVHDGWLVSPDGHTPTHILLDTDGGPEAFDCDPIRGQAVLDALYGGGPSTSSAPPTQSRK